MSKWSAAFRDSRWQQKRLQIMERDGWQCTDCDCESPAGATLNVHHIYYESNKAPWDYEDSVLVTRCEACHTKMHELQKRLLLAINWVETPTALIKQLIGYADSYSGPSSNSGQDYEAGFAAQCLHINSHVAKMITDSNQMNTNERVEL
jgi:5-methylcytosine-specific restriction enzyme A